MLFSVGLFLWISSFFFFWKLCSAWTSIFSLFENFSFYILSLLHTKAIFLIVSFCAVPFFLVGKNCFLFLGPPKRVMFLCVFSFLFFLFSKKKNAKYVVFNCFWPFFLEACRFLFSFFLISFATCFLCKNVFFTSLFPPFVHPHSIRSLFFVSSCFPVFFTFFLLFYTSFWTFYNLYVSKILFFCLLFSIEKTPFSLFLFLLSFFLHWFMFHVLSFSVSWKMVSHFVLLSFFDSSF